MNFDKLGLRPELVRAVAANGYTETTPIQARSIPEILLGKDILGGAQTGTGKTAAFALPILHLLGGSEKRPKNPRALILTPTRELADQVGESFASYGRFLNLRSMKIFGGVGMEPQKSALRKGTDIVIATPGRLLDHLRQRTIRLSDIEILVLDEADRMLDMGFIRDIKAILGHLPSNRQNLLFSATYSDEIKALASDMLKNPVEIEVCARNRAAEKVEQCVYPIETAQKRHLLAHLIKKESWFQVLVFVKTKHGANRLSEQLAKTGISAMAIHGNKSQSARTRALESFKKGSIQALIATDIAARGLDLENLEHVVNFELPNVPEDYVHRIGRTGRAGKSGKAISLVSQGEKNLLAQIERLLKNRIPVAAAEDFKPVDQPAQKDSGEDRQKRVKRFVTDRRNSGTKRPANRGSNGKKPAQNGNSRQSA